MIISGFNIVLAILGFGKFSSEMSEPGRIFIFYCPESVFKFN